MAKVIFLDVDGVLNSARWFDHRGLRPPDRPLFDHNVDPATIVHLNRLCLATGAGLVVSSVWRKGCTLARLRADFVRVGCQGRIVGATPDLHGTPRGAEIAAWLAQHPTVTQFVILDDSADMDGLTPRLVQTVVDTGLTAADVDRALALLR